ncbi:MAG TPA: ATP-binding protein [Methylomirabilota bacterium]|nr:ATP-binding protein [Methylomirabilota bacterium]
MKTLLILSQYPEFYEGIRAALDPQQYRVVERLNFEEAEPLVGRGLFDAAIIDVESSGVQALWTVEKLRRRLPTCPVVVFTGSRPWEFEEEAFIQGVAHVLSKPVRARLLNAVLERLAAVPATTSRPGRGEGARPPEKPRLEAGGELSSYRALEVLRDFSAILTHSLCAEALLKQFLLMIREILGVNRAAIFLRQPVTTFGGPAAVEGGRRMRSACAIGLAPGLLEHFELSFESGIGGHLFHYGRILRRDSEEVQRDREMQKEFELLGVEVAIPMLDRETLVGVATFDGRVTGEPLVNGELELVFHLLEELGLAVKNIWLHDQLSANHGILTDVLRELNCACVVVSRDLVILHANRMARKFFLRAGRSGGELEFSDLPQALGSKVYQVLKTGTGVAPFKFEPADKPGGVFQVTVLPLDRANAIAPESALLIVDDFTQSEQFKRLELEAASLRLIKTIAERLAHEIGNALVPISTYQQLMGEKFRDPEFRASFDQALSQGVRRVARLTSQMRFLAREGTVSQEAFPVSELIEDAFAEVKHQAALKSATLKYDDASRPIILAGDRPALKHALSEVLLNAALANPEQPDVTVRTETENENNGTGWMHIDVIDHGPGFTPDSIKRATEPFFTTRTVGLGLGLAVTRKIVEMHSGKLEIPPPKVGGPGLVRIRLPLHSPVSINASAPVSPLR